MLVYIEKDVFVRLLYNILFTSILNPLSANPTKWSNTNLQFANELFECV